MIYPCRSIRNEPTEDEMNVVRKLAGHILEKIQEHLIILPNMIVASILLQNPTGIDLGTTRSTTFHNLLLRPAVFHCSRFARAGGANMVKLLL